MLISNNTNKNSYTPYFQKFLKTKASRQKLELIKKQISNTIPNSITFISKNNKHKNVLYIFTEEHSEKFFDLIPKLFFRDFRTNPEKYMTEKAQKVKSSNILEELTG